MDPSGMGTRAQSRPSGEELNGKHLPTKMTLAGTFSEAVTAHADEQNAITAPNGGLQPFGAECRGGEVDEMVTKPKEQKGWRKIIRNFTPS